MRGKLDSIRRLAQAAAVCPTSLARPPTGSGNPRPCRWRPPHRAPLVRAPGSSAEHPPQDSPSLPFGSCGLPHEVDGACMEEVARVILALEEHDVAEAVMHFLDRTGRARVVATA